MDPLINGASKVSVCGLESKADRENMGDAQGLEEWHQGALHETKVGKK